MSLLMKPTYAVICDLCGADAMEHTEYIGYGDKGDAYDVAVGNDWLITNLLDICDAHSTGWAEENPTGTCYSCDEDDEQVWFGNCAECWEKAMSGRRTPAPPKSIAEEIAVAIEKNARDQWTLGRDWVAVAAAMAREIGEAHG